jgi:hypothetical protein
VVLALALGLVGTLALLALPAPPAPNGLGILPSALTSLQASGLTLATPTGPAGITARRAAAAASSTQSGSAVESEALATVIGPGRDRLGPPGQLCWVVFLNPGSGGATNLEEQGDVEFDAVLVNAHSGSVIAGFISFRSSTPGSRVGSE